MWDFSEHKLWVFSEVGGFLEDSSLPNKVTSSVLEQSGLCTQFYTCPSSVGRRLLGDFLIRLLFTVSLFVCVASSLIGILFTA